MRIDKNEMLDYLEQNNPDIAKNMKSILDRKIPYEDWQLSLMFSRRGSGKSFMSYGLMAEKIIDKLKYTNYKEVYLVGTSGRASELRGIIMSEVFIVSYLDPDVTSYDRLVWWVNKFREFIEAYYPELLIESPVKAGLIKVRLQ